MITVFKRCRWKKTFDFHNLMILIILVEIFFMVKYHGFKIHHLFQENTIWVKIFKLKWSYLLSCQLHSLVRVLHICCVLFELLLFWLVAAVSHLIVHWYGSRSQDGQLQEHCLVVITDSAIQMISGSKNSLNLQFNRTLSNIG